METLQRDHSLVAQLCKPQIAFTIACLSVTALAIVSVWRNQDEGSKVAHKGEADATRATKTPGTKHQAPEDQAPPEPQDSKTQPSHIAQLSALTSTCAAFSGILHDASMSNDSLRQQIPSILDANSALIGLMCEIQRLLTRDPTCFFSKTGLAAVFETTSNSIVSSYAAMEKVCETGASKTDLHKFLDQISTCKSTLEFVKTTLEPQEPSQRPTVHFARAESSFVPGHKRSLTVPVPQPATTVVTPGVDVKKWLEEPPESEGSQDSEPLPEYSPLPLPASPSKQSNISVKRNVVSMADIHSALSSKRPEEELQSLLDTGADPNESYGRLSRTALHEAARVNDSGCIRLLINAGALINTDDAKGDSPLHLAAWEGHVEACAALLDAGSDIDRLSGRDGCSPLFCAIGARHIDLVRLLLRKGARVSLKSPGDMYPLHQASVTGQIAVCDALLAAGAQPDPTDKEGNTPLHCAATIGSVDIITLLLKHGADVDAKQERGMTPLHWASHKGHEAAVRALLNAGAEEDEREQSGATPLCCAASRGHFGCVKALLKRGANRKLVCEAWDGGSGTPAQLAKRNGHKEVVALLKTYGN